MYENDGKKRKKEDRKKEDSTDNEPDIKPTAKRHLIFIRHGQYQDDKENDEDRVLTELGR
jgi:serine/threonine-protein phosphatase PGAM5